MSEFLSRLNSILDGRDGRGRRHIFVAYDQLNDQIGALADSDPDNTTAVFIETTWKPARRPYHKQKLAWILANQRHFALELAHKGFAIDYRFDDRNYGEVLADVARDTGPIVVMEPAERELRRSLDGLIDKGLIEIVDHDGWITSTRQFQESQRGDTPWRMDAFYRRIRRDTGLLMDDGEPVGGKFSFDEDNREFWRGEPSAPKPPKFEPDDIVCEVGRLIDDAFSDHPGELDLRRVAATADQAQAFWQWAKQECMPSFGPFEDAMSTESRTLFHTLISPLLNLHRLLPGQVVEDVAALDIPINSKEGFIRQVAGWREFMRHVYRQTDGFRDLPEGVEANYLDAHRSLPATFWGDAPSGMNCLDEVVLSVVEDGYSHHITRLMILANIATLLDVSPREVTDWFWVMYIDAYDWVVEPNVRGMGMFALGDLFTTKPYVSGSNYIDNMSDYCGQCQFDPGDDCPIRSLYWGFLERHRAKLEDLGRMGLMLSMLSRRSDEQKNRDRQLFDAVHASLQDGQRLTPDILERAVDDRS